MSVELASGTTLSFDWSGGITLLELNTCTPPSITANAVDVTDMDSDAREFKPSIPDNGQIVFNANFRDDIYLYLHGIALTKPQVPIRWTLTFPDAGTKTWVFDGLVSDITGAAPSVDGKITMDVTIKVTGAFV